MSRHQIGYQLTYTALARQHRPDDPDLLAREAAALADAGLTYDDIAATLGLTKDAVKQLLNPKET